MVYFFFKWCCKAGEVYALFRTDCGSLAEATSLDFGHTWPKEAHPQPLLPSTR